MTANLKHRACITCCKTKCTNINDRRSVDGRILHINKTVDNLLNCTQSLCNFKHSVDDTDEYVILYDKSTSTWVPTKTTDLYVNIYKNPRFTMFFSSSSTNGLRGDYTLLFYLSNGTDEPPTEYNILDTDILNKSQIEYVGSENLKFELLDSTVPPLAPMSEPSWYNNPPAPTPASPPTLISSKVLCWKGNTTINVSVVVNIVLQRRRNINISLELYSRKNGNKIPNVSNIIRPHRNVTTSSTLSFITSLNPGDNLDFILQNVKVTIGGSTDNFASCYIRSLDIKVYALNFNKLPVTVITPP